jgi:FkbM family methyltransferase
VDGSLVKRASLRMAALVCRRFQDFPGRWRLVRWAIRHIRQTGSSMRQTTVSTVHGFRFTCDLADWIGQYVFVTGAYEEPTSALMAELVRPGDLAVDVGANVGFFTLLLSRLVGESGRVIAFEPMPHALDRLRAHVALNRCNNVVIRDCALGSEAGTSQLYLGPRHHTSTASLKPRPGAATVDVACTTLDEALGAESLVACLKIDAEGWEPEVLAGAGRVLAQESAPFVIAEVSEPAWPAMLLTRGYEMFAIDRDGLRSPSEWQDSGQFNALFTRRPVPAHVTVASR